MSRRLLALFVGSLMGSTAYAGLPDPSLSTVPPIMMVPNNNPGVSIQTVNSLGYTVTVIGQQGPVANAVVTITFSAQADALISWCNGLDGAPTSPPPLTATTNSAGQATFRISGGGCIVPGQVSPWTAEVSANGVILRTDAAIISMDAVNKVGQTTAVSGTSNCDPEGAGYETRVSLSDAVFHTGPFSTGVYNACSDFTGDGVITTADAVIATQFITDSNTCTCDP
jgi:hypothetical protein